MAMTMTNSDNNSSVQIFIKRFQEMILSGKLKVGDKLPAEREMIKVLDIGRPALREGLRALELLGLIETHHGIGSFISNHVTESYFKPLSLSFVLSGGTDQEILETRYCIETFAVAHAAEHATEEDIRELRSYCDKMAKAPSVGEKSVHDRNFHGKIVEMAGNKLITDTYQGISYLMRTFVIQTVTASYEEGDSIENIYKEHQAVLDAIEKRDSDAARKAMEAHLKSIILSRL